VKIEKPDTEAAGEGAKDKEDDAKSGAADEASKPDAAKAVKGNGDKAKPSAGSGEKPKAAKSNGKKDSGAKD